MTAAVVIAVAVGGLSTAHLWGLFVLVADAHGGLTQDGAGSSGWMFVALSCRVFDGLLYLWGGFAAWRGRSRIVLGAAAVLHAVFAAAVLLTTTLFAVLDLFAAALILTLLLLPSSSRFFSAQGRKAG
ncbi:hypothetical protein A9X01_20360 [Mycobacterium asiaticum]|uniref:Uncharacterized protein n=1 Tax=Mycobacterium asiaticum TaxID=1790 RepID=A0A1A3C9D5_MYCAS|nr:hypothetical protein A9X01_20360 [Mycobacterium asiaticum]